MFMISRYVQDPDYIKGHAREIRWRRTGTAGGVAGRLQIILDKGQEDDWFGATWIRWAFGVLVVCFVLFLIREFRHEQAAGRFAGISTSQLRFRLLLIGLFGAAIYGLVTLLPLFYQELMGYTALAAGWAVSPRGSRSDSGHADHRISDGENR